MAYAPKRSAAAANAACDAMAALCNSGKLRIYTGSSPGTCDAAIGAVTLLAELTMNASAFGAASSGVCTAAAISADASANDTGTAGWFRIWASNGTSPIYEGTVGTTGCDLNLNTLSIVTGASVSITSLTLTESLG